MVRGFFLEAPRHLLLVLIVVEGSAGYIARCGGREILSGDVGLRVSRNGMARHELRCISY